MHTCCTAKTVDLKSGLGKTLSLETITEAIKTHKPAVLFLCQVTSHFKPPSK